MLIKNTNLHFIWTEGKNQWLPDLLIRSLASTSHDAHRLETVAKIEMIYFPMKNVKNNQEHTSFLKSRSYKKSKNL